MDSSNIYDGNSTSPVTGIDLCACRVCLATDTKLFHIHECGLVEIFAAVISETVPINDGFPQHLCHYCFALLHKFATFKSKCEWSHDILQSALLLNQTITTDFLRTIDREAESLNLPLAIHDAGLIDFEFIEEAVEIAEKDIKEEVTYDEEHLEIKEEVSAIPTSANIGTDYELPGQLYIFNKGSDAQALDEGVRGITSENNDDDLKLEPKCDYDGSAMSTDDVKCEDQEDMPLSTGCTRYNMLKDSKAEANCDADLADDVTEFVGQFQAKGADVVKQESNEKANKAMKHYFKNTEDKQKKIAKTQCEEINNKPIKTTKNELNINPIYQCDICNKTFKSKPNIIVHIKSHRLNSDRSIKMNKQKGGVSRKIPRQMKRSKKYKHELTPEVHSPTKLSQRSYEKRRHQCDQCPYNTTHTSHFNRHLRTHTGEKPFTCDICSFKTGRKSCLIDHTRIHTGEKPFNCDVCSFKTKVQSSLIRHNKIHTGEKPFSCDICSYKTDRKGYLIAHTKIHTGEKLFACHFCPYRAIDKRNLRNHINKRHSREMTNEML